jgi:hypothetical protein
MKPEHLDNIGLLAMTLYALAALSFYLSWFVQLGPFVNGAIAAFLLLPPVWAGAKIYDIVRRRRNWGFAPRGLAAFALGSGAAVLLGFCLIFAGAAAFSRAFPIPALEDCIGPTFFLVFPYALLSAALSVATVVALPMLIWRSLRKPVPES